MNETTSTLHIVLSCIKELTANTGMAPRAAIIESTGLSPHIIKERIDELLESGQIKRRERGVYQHVTVFAPARAISKTALTDGEVILEVGDTVLHLTPAEERMMRSMFGSATVELQQAPATAPQTIPRPSALVMSLDDIAEVFCVSRRVARDKIVKDPGFPPTIPGSSERKMMWAKSAVMEYLGVPA
jgi:hypothetical protein